MQSLLSSRFYRFFTLLLFSSLLYPEANFSLANLDPNSQTVDVLYDFSEDVAGFQFIISNINNFNRYFIQYYWFILFSNI